MQAPENLQAKQARVRGCERQNLQAKLAPIDPLPAAYFFTRSILLCIRTLEGKDDTPFDTEWKGWVLTGFFFLDAWLLGACKPLGPLPPAAWLSFFWLLLPRSPVTTMLSQHQPVFSCPLVGTQEGSLCKRD